MVDFALVVPKTHLSEDLVLVPIENSGVGILPAIESTFEDRKLEAYATFEDRKLEAYATFGNPKIQSGRCPSRRVARGWEVVKFASECQNLNLI